MKKISKLAKYAIPGAITLGIVYWLYKKYVVKAITAANLNIKVSDINFPKKIIVLSITNPYKSDLLVDSIQGDLIFNDNSFASFSNFDKINIAKNSTTKLNLRVKLNLLNAAGILTDLIGKNKEQRKEYFLKGNFRVQGTANSSGLLFKFNQFYSF
tara:strand:- start:5542 stop:6009 length:468 start_codon:yes stop_codon:yes gene_type:complete